MLIGLRDMNKIKKFIEAVGTIIAIGGLFAVIGAYFLFPFIILATIIWAVLRFT